MDRNHWCIEVAKEIVIAKMQTSSASTNKDSGKAHAQYLETIYNKVVELSSKQLD